MTGYESIKVEHDKQIGIVTLDRPEKYNAWRCQVEPGDGGRGRPQVHGGRSAWWSCAHSTKGDVAPGSVRVGADLSVGGGGQSVSTWTEVVRDSAERAEEALRVLG